MAPTTYGDLGKSARDVIGKGYHFSLMKLELKTKTASGVEFTSGEFKLTTKISKHIVSSGRLINFDASVCLSNA